MLYIFPPHILSALHTLGYLLTLTLNLETSYVYTNKEPQPPPIVLGLSNL